MYSERSLWTFSFVSTSNTQEKCIWRGRYHRVNSARHQVPKRILGSVVIIVTRLEKYFTWIMILNLWKTRKSNHWKIIWIKILYDDSADLLLWLFTEETIHKKSSMRGKHLFWFAIWIMWYMIFYDLYKSISDISIEYGTTLLNLEW